MIEAEDVLGYRSLVDWFGWWSWLLRGGVSGGADREGRTESHVFHA